MTYDIEAIIKAYSGTVVSVDGAKELLIKMVIKYLQIKTKINAARVELDKEYAETQYIRNRTRKGTTKYAKIEDQLAMLYDDMLAGKLDSTGTFFAHNKAVKRCKPEILKVSA